MGCVDINKKKILSYIMIFALVPLLIFTGVSLLADRQYMVVSIAIAVLSCISFFVSFEKREKNTQRIVILAVMVALSVVGRFAFSYVPFFKPVTAIVMICGIYMGAEAGFLCGALSAFISNFIFMQGPWTPFQMFIWGAIGFMASLTSPLLKKNKIALSIGGALAGVVYSMFMDIWTVLWWDSTFSLSRYAAAITTALPITAIYAVSNVIFLLLLTQPIGKKLERIKKKYGV